MCKSVEIRLLDIQACRTDVGFLKARSNGPISEQKSGFRTRVCEETSKSDSNSRDGRPRRPRLYLNPSICARWSVSIAGETGRGGGRGGNRKCGREIKNTNANRTFVVQSLRLEMTLYRLQKQQNKSHRMDADSSLVSPRDDHEKTVISSKFAKCHLWLFNSILLIMLKKNSRYSRWSYDVSFLFPKAISVSHFTLVFLPNVLITYCVSER